jgi:hypothetical protein
MMKKKESMGSKLNSYDISGRCVYQTISNSISFWHFHQFFFFVSFERSWRKNVAKWTKFHFFDLEDYASKFHRQIWQAFTSEILTIFHGTSWMSFTSRFSCLHEMLSVNPNKGVAREKFSKEFCESWLWMDRQFWFALKTNEVSREWHLTLH